MTRKAKLKLYALTSTAGLATIAPPVRLLNKLPSWWTQLDAYADLGDPKGPLAKRFRRVKIPTARHCYSMQEVFKRGIGLPLWSDTRVVIDADGRLDVEGRNPQVPAAGTAHPEQQFAGLAECSVQHLKFMSPWSFVCERAVQFLWAHPFYHQPNVFRFHTLPGIVEYRNQHATNVNVMLSRRSGERQEFEFVAGELLAYIFPVSDDKLTLSVEEVSERELDRVNCASKVTAQPLLLNRKLGMEPWLPRRVQWPYMRLLHRGRRDS